MRAAPVAWTVLRPTMVYGPAAKGNLATLQRLADTPWPLPLAAFNNRRSLVSLDNLVAAVLFALGAPATERQTYLVADPAPVTLAEIIAALRNGLGSRAASSPCRRQCSRLRCGSSDAVMYGSGSVDRLSSILASSSQPVGARTRTR